MKWEIDKEAVEEAKQILGIKRPVKFMRVMMHDWGRHWYLHIGQKVKSHKVIINKGLSIKRANNTVWHELTHCSQVERMGPDLFDKTMWMGLQSIGLSRSSKAYNTPKYRRLPLEAEANSTAERYQHIMLVRPV